MAMTTSPLSQAQTARLLAAEFYRLKSEHTLLNGECGILQDLRDAEERVHEAARTQPAWTRSLYFHTARCHELDHEIDAVLAKSIDVLDQLVRFGNEGLSQASFSALGTMTIGERSFITHTLGHQEFKDGAVLIKQGEPRDALLIIVQGQVSCAQRRGHRCEVGPARAALLERPSAPAPQRACASAPRDARAPVLRPARLAVCSGARGPI